jgi:acyl-CoA reductase-like NAD-dependent aldehyde dehydrogenase
MGPLISAGHRDTVSGFLDGADIAFRGSAPQGDGFWFAPAVVLADPTDRIAQQEVFGPVVAVMPFDDEADAIRLANDTPYGLAGSLWTENLGRAVRVSRGMQSGVLSVNSHSSVRYTTPFGGMKASGLGRELGPDAAEHFTQTKNVFFATDL